MKIGIFSSSRRAFILLLSTFAALVSAPPLSAAVLRTLAYHQITQFRNNFIYYGGRTVVLSADGRKIAFARPYYSSPMSNLIYSVNFDGTNLKLVDMWQGGGGAQVDISADGSKILSWEGGTVRAVNADGSNPHQVVQVTDGYLDFRLSPDGTQVFLSDSSPFNTVPDTGLREPGLYAVSVNATNFHEIAGLTSFALFFGIPQAQLIPSGYFYGWNGGNPFGLSGDGSKLVCFVWTPTGYRVLGMTTTGTSVHELPLGTTPIYNFEKVGLSGDGNKAFYYFNCAPCCSSGEELGVLNWDGSGRRVLWSTYNTNQSTGSLGLNNVSVNHDASKLLFGETSWLFNTDGSGRLELGWTARFAESRILRWGFYGRSMMDSNGTHFAFLTPLTGNSGTLQVATGELNPTNFGLAPTITAPSATPEFTTTNGSSFTFACRPAPTNTLVSGGGVQAGILLNGIADPSPWQGSTLHDDGASGDTVSGDGVFADNTGYFYNYPAIGPRTLRFKAELLGADGNFHATAIDMTPFFVVGQVPTNPPPAIISFAPTNAAPGSQVTITGTGFDPMATNNIILFGNQQAQVISVNPAGTQLIVVVPGGLPVGPVMVTISSQGQTSGSSSFGVPDPFASSLVVKMLAGLDIYGTIGMTYRIDYLTDLNNPNSWLVLTNITLPASPYFWVDVSSASQPRRFYRSVSVP
jgi:hypothetical protein